MGMGFLPCLDIIKDGPPPDDDDGVLAPPPCCLLPASLFSMMAKRNCQDESRALH